MSTEEILAEIDRRIALAKKHEGEAKVKKWANTQAYYEGKWVALHNIKHWIEENHRLASNPVSM